MIPLTYETFKTKYKINLNQQQESAVRETEGAVLLLAVPGSGKTTVLVSRLGYMIHCKEIKPEQILTVTYTVAATLDMKNRFEKKFGPEVSERLTFRTINGISYKILQYFGELTGKSVYDVADKEIPGIIQSIFRTVTGNFATENDCKLIQTGITFVKNMRMGKTEIKQHDFGIEEFPRIYELYCKELKKLQKIDYDDQMVYALKILEQYPQVLDFFQDKYHYICVDEAQDTSKIQHDILALLSSKHQNLFMVGDEDQSIYGFRAAYPKALITFEKRFHGAKILYMESNYRSREEIVKVADKFIQTNQNRHKKRMCAKKTAGGCVKKIEVKNRKYQFQYLMKVARESQREIAILYRNNESALPLIDVLSREGIPYRIRNTDMTFFSHPVVRDLTDFISFAMNQSDADIFLRIYYKMGAGISKAVADYAINHNKGEHSLIEMLLEECELSQYSVKQCRSLLTHFKNMLHENAGKAIYRILHYMGYQEFMDSRNMDQGKAEILKILGDQSASPQEFLHRLNELKEIMSAGTTDLKANLILSTIHSSKGLEYERVYLADVLEGVLPGLEEPKGRNNSMEEISLYEEERRLFYVGMTRAKQELYIFTFENGSTSKFSKDIFGISEQRRQPVSNLKNSSFNRPLWSGLK